MSPIHSHNTINLMLVACFGILLTTAPALAHDIAPMRAHTSFKTKFAREALANAVCALEPVMSTDDGRARPIDVWVDGRRCSQAPEPFDAVVLVVDTRQQRVEVEASGDATSHELDTLVAQTAQELAVRAASSASEANASRNFPERLGGVTDFSTSALAFMSITNGGCVGWFCVNPVVNGGGALFAASVMHHFKAPVLIGASIDPVGFGSISPSPYPLTGSSTAPAFTGSVFGALDTRFVEVGAGVGAAALGDGTTDFMIATRARLGATDGLSFRCALMFVVPHDAVIMRGALGPVGVSLLGSLAMQIPLASRVALELDLKLGAGAVGDGLVGARFRVAGDGGRRSVYLTTSLGIAIVNGSATATVNNAPVTLTYSAGGPAVAFGIDWRL